MRAGTSTPILVPAAEIKMGIENKQQRQQQQQQQQQQSSDKKQQNPGYLPCACRDFDANLSTSCRDDDWKSQQQQHQQTNNNGNNISQTKPGILALCVLLLCNQFWPSAVDGIRDKDVWVFLQNLHTLATGVLMMFMIMMMMIKWCDMMMIIIMRGCFCRICMH